MANYKLGLDIGNSGIKMVGKIKDKHILDNVKTLVSHDSTENTNVVVLGEETGTIHFGVGDPLVLQDKTKNPYIKHIILLAIVKIYGKLKDCDHVTIGVGLPLKRYKHDASRIAFEKQLAEIKEVYGTVNGESYIYSVNIEVKAEGFSAFYYLMPTLDKSTTWLIPDHGYRTTDVIAISYSSVQNKWIVNNYDSFDKGLLEMYSAISKHFSEQTGQDIMTPDRVEYCMQENTKVIVPDPNDANSIIEANYNDYTIGAKHVIDLLYKAIEAKFTDSSIRKILLIGGGADLVYKHLELRNKVLQGKLEERIYANAIGYYLQLK